MKKLLLAIAVSLVLVLIYYSVVYLISPIVLGTPPLSPHPTLYVPLSLPGILYEATAPDALQDMLAATPGGGALLSVLFIIVNTALLSIPLYLLLALLSGIRGQR